MNTAYETAMRVALDHAELAASSGDVPVGAVVLHNYEIIVLTFVIVYTINARPMCFSNVFPHSFIYL